MKRMISRLMLTMMLAAGTMFLNAQDVPFKKKHFPNHQKEFSKAKKSLKKGMKLAGKGDDSREKALSRLTAAHSFNPRNAKLNHKIGELYLLTSKPYLSKPYLETAHELNPKLSSLLKLQLGRSYHLNHQFSDAIRLYDEHLQGMSQGEVRRKWEFVVQWRAQCVLGDSLMANPVNVYIDPMDDRINSQWPEYAPVLSHDGSRLWFTSRRPVSTGGKTAGDNLPFEDIYYLEKLGTNWSAPVNAGPGLNTDHHDAFVAVSDGGQKIYIRRGEPVGDILMLDWPLKKNPRKEVNIKGINSSSNETFGSFSPGGDTLWFVSTRKRGYGGKDIWVATKNSHGKWGKPVNAGPVINTPMDEESPFYAADEKTLYFSSRGHESMGGYDIFAVTLTDSGYMQRRNLGWPVNSASDDLFFSLCKNGHIGYFASNRPGGYGHFDLFMLTMIGEEKPLLFIVDAPHDELLQMSGTSSILPVGNMLKPEQVIVIQGVVTSQGEGLPVSALISVRDRNSGAIIATTTSDPISGKYIMKVNAENSLAIRIIATGKALLSAAHDFSRVAPYSIHHLNFELQTLSSGVVIPLNNLLFAEGERDVLPGSEEELDMVAGMLKENLPLKIAIAANSYDGEVAELPAGRVAKVKQALINKGVAADRINTEVIDFAAISQKLPSGGPLPAVLIVIF